MSFRLRTKSLPINSIEYEAREIRFETVRNGFPPAKRYALFARAESHTRLET